MKIPKEAEQKILQLQLLEQNIQALSMQRQTFQSQLFEIDNALEELKESKDKVYRVVGGIMILSNKQNIEKDLKSKKEVLELRIKNLESQEKKVKEKAEEIQKEVLKQLKNE